MNPLLRLRSDPLVGLRRSDWGRVRDRLKSQWRRRRPRHHGHGPQGRRRHTRQGSRRRSRRRAARSLCGREGALRSGHPARWRHAHRYLERSCAQLGDIGAALFYRAKCGCRSLLTKGKKKMQTPCFSLRSTRGQLSRPLHYPRNCVARVVGVDPRCTNQDVGVEPPLRQKIRRGARQRRDRREQMPGRRRLFLLLRKLVGQPAQSYELGFIERHLL